VVSLSAALLPVAVGQCFVKPDIQSIRLPAALPSHNRSVWASPSGRRVSSASLAAWHQAYKVQGDGSPTALQRLSRPSSYTNAPRTGPARTTTRSAGQARTRAT
jgi:hypothetical protein